MLKPIHRDYRAADILFRPSDRLHRLAARLLDSHVDDLTDDRVDEIERLLDSFRITHGDGSSFGARG